MIENKKDFKEYINKNREILINEISDHFFNTYPDIAEKYNEYQKEKTKEDFSFNLTYLIESISLSNENIFLDYIIWLKSILIKHDVDMKDFTLSFNILRDKLTEKIDNDEIKTIINKYIYDANRIIMDEKIQNSNDLINEDNPYKELTEEYTSLLLNGNRNKAMKLILESVNNKISIKDIYIHVFQNSLYEIGELWKENIISIAQEHYCTAATQLIMSQLYPYIFNTQKKGLKFVSASVSGELHEIGIRMISDFLEMEGWDTYYLGSNMPTDGIINSAKENKADLIGISCTMMFHLDSVTEIINKIRNTDTLKNINIIVGGYPFNKQPDLWKKIGADAYAKNTLEAVEKAKKLIQNR